MSVRFVGFFGAEQPRELLWTKSEGWTRVRRFRGLKAWCAARIKGLINSGADEVHYVEEQNPYATLEARFAGTSTDGEVEAPINRWEIFSNNLQRDLFEHPKAKAISNSNLARLKKEVNDFEKGEDTAFDVPDTDAQDLYNLLTTGTKSYYKFQWVIRKTHTVSSAWEIVLGVSGVENVWTLDRIAQWEANFGGPMTNLVYAAAKVIDTPKAIKYYTWGWLKQSPTYNQTAHNKYEITQEWWLEYWPTSLYKNF